ncbi:hypothetical protein AB205_0113530, partial [Aquarana catesbeiana]
LCLKSPKVPPSFRFLYKKIVTTTGDVDVVEEESHFTSASAHILIGEIMVCNRDLQKIKEDINDVEKNIIDVLGRI